MNKQSIKDISQKSGRSVSTVSKVLRNCPGVDPETRDEIRSAMESESVEGLRPMKNAGSATCVILPDNPKYFWNRALPSLNRSNLPMITKIYSSIRQDGEDREVSRCLREAVKENASAIILAASPGEALSREIAELAKTMLIIQLCEYTPIPNTFFVGSDFWGDGRALSEAVRSEEGSAPCVGLLSKRGILSCEERTRGFLEGLDSHVRTVRIECPEYSSLFSSHLARAIHGTGEPLDYLFVPMGMTDKACDALYKLRDKMQAQCIGFEFPSMAKKYWQRGQIAALAVQDVEEQMDLALTFVRQYLEERRFPDRKMNRLASSIRIWDREEMG